MGTLDWRFGPECNATRSNPFCLRAIRIGNLVGNAFDALLCRASRGRFGCQRHPVFAPERKVAVTALLRR
jgi:hypothetical protein